MMAKYNDYGIRECDQDGCKHTATHWLVWTKPQVYCYEHMERVLNVASVMGHPTPASTMRAIRPEEQLREDVINLASSASINGQPPNIVILMGDRGLETFELPKPDEEKPAE